ncbi:protein fam98a-like, partial [Cystoisospora suis]
MTRASSSASSVDSFGGCVGLEELRGALETSYDTINKKRTNTYSQQEILLFLNDESFFPLVRQIISEIQYLEEGKTSPKSDVKQKEALLSFIQSRGYLLPRESLSSLGTSEEDFSLKRLLLYNLLADLQTCRLLAKKRIRRDLAFASLAGPGEGEGNERRSHAVEDQAKEKSQQALEMIKKISNTLGVYTEKEGCCDTFRDAVQLDLLSKALEKNGRSHPLPQSKEALVPAPPPSSTSGDKLLSIVERLDAEYLLRRRVMLRRLDVTVQAFLWSRKAQENDRAVATVLQDMRSWRDRLLNRHINLYDVFAIKKSLFTTRLSLPISRSTMCDEEEGRDTCPSSSSSRSPLAIKNLIIGPVPDRGGIPEGYSMHQVRQDVLRANEYMRSKDSSSSSS